jgi:hypothetical protein
VISKKALRSAVLVVAAAAGMALVAGNAVGQESPDSRRFTKDFRFADCDFTSGGENPYFRLRPGRLVLEAEEDGEVARVEITVLREFERLYVPGLGWVRTRVIEERETVDDELVEVSRNFFAMCTQTDDLVYFGEDVDIYHEDGSVTHEGAWRAGQPDGNGLAQPGILMPGRFLLGARYYQELADGIALDRAEHMEMGLVVTTKAGRFRECVRIVETTPLEPGHESVKVYCRGIGLVMDNEAQLVEYDFGDDREDDDTDDD